MQFYREGLEMLLRSPVIGVGMDQFIFHSNTQHVAHSEYVEVFSDTGIVGGLLYFSIFVVLWIRAGKIAKYTDDITQFRIARLVRAILIVIAVSNVGRWNYYDKITWVIFASFIGYTSAVWQELSARMAAAKAEQMAALETGASFPGQ
jgi:O-antigen ligase